MSPPPRATTASETWDVTIVGGGPAGSCAAAFAQQAGLSVLLLEKEPFPRFRIGESLLPQGNPVLRATGVWPELVRAGFIEKRGAVFFTADGSQEREIVFADGIVPGLESTFQVERSRFDALLLDHARRLGVQVRLPATVTAVEETAAHVIASYRDEEGDHRVESRWLLDGSGRDRLFPSPLKRDIDPSRLARRVAIYSHFSGVSRAPGAQAGHTVVVRVGNGWFWLIPIDDDRTSIGLVTTVHAMRASRLPPAALFEREVEASPKLRELMRGSSPVFEFKLTADYSYFHRTLARGRVVLLGDAAGFFDPIFSSGVYLACRSAQVAVAMITRAEAAGRPLRAAECRRYARAIKGHARVFEKLINAFYDNDSFSVFLSPRPPFGIDRGVNAIVAGHSRLIWPVWWRFRLFLLVCLLQRWFSLVPRLAFGRPD